ncbi:type II secretion system protein [Acetivibrio cellulolyticus]|uniref:type II secretion system protein n=1 Tax=Acetivibrio cellulolyticus TaxID=35830 RepID=UPI0001E2C6F6|nr:type II secretion system protein [Acetivibrio cellulolyticus]
MKKMLRNKKGFSLIELLIVIAIMGVLAVIAFSMFSGVVANSRKKADIAQAGNIQKALVAYIVDTGDANLTYLKDGSTGITSGSTSWATVVRALQQDQTVATETYKAYLNAKNGSAPSSVDFKTQWNENNGYHIEVYPSKMNATVVPAPKTGGDPTIKIN